MKSFTSGVIKERKTFMNKSKGVSASFCPTLAPDLNLTQKQLQSKKDLNKRAFTSQIDTIPGPKLNLAKDKEGKKKEVEKGKAKQADEKRKLKVNQLYGAFYQEGVAKAEPSRAYKTYIKSVQDKWNRNPDRKETKEARQRLYWN